mmetsp:Transcript_114532/g.311007  ORF Transcript_114532/g.311007 Transcript_114532/m.311007 type:complete len:399 (-) Transcript_114532:28-1224(-)
MARRDGGQAALLHGRGEAEGAADQGQQVPVDVLSQLRGIDPPDRHVDRRERERRLHHGQRPERHEDQRGEEQHPGQVVPDLPRRLDVTRHLGDDEEVRRELELLHGLARLRQHQHRVPRRQPLLLGLGLLRRTLEDGAVASWTVRHPAAARHVLAAPGHAAVARASVACAHRLLEALAPAVADGRELVGGRLLGTPPGLADGEDGDLVPLLEVLPHLGAREVPANEGALLRDHELRELVLPARHVQQVHAADPQGPGGLVQPALQRLLAGRVLPRTGRGEALQQPRHVVRLRESQALLLRQAEHQHVASLHRLELRHGEDLAAAGVPRRQQVLLSQALGGRVAPGPRRPVGRRAGAPLRERSGGARPPPAGRRGLSAARRRGAASSPGCSAARAGRAS